MDISTLQYDLALEQLNKLELDVLDKKYNEEYTRLIKLIQAILKKEKTLPYGLTSTNYFFRTMDQLKKENRASTSELIIVLIATSDLLSGTLMPEDYLELALKVQGKPNPSLQILGAVMLAMMIPCLVGLMMFPGAGLFIACIVLLYSFEIAGMLTLGAGAQKGLSVAVSSIGSPAKVHADAEKNRLQFFKDGDRELEMKPLTTHNDDVDRLVVTM